MELEPVEETSSERELRGRDRVNEYVLVARSRLASVIAVVTSLTSVEGHRHVENGCGHGASAGCRMGEGLVHLGAFRGAGVAPGERMP